MIRIIRLELDFRKDKVVVGFGLGEFLESGSYGFAWGTPISPEVDDGCLSALDLCDRCEN